LQGDTDLNEERQYYRPDEVAEHFRISRSYVYFLIRHKKIRAVKIGRLIRISREEYCRICQGINEFKACQPNP
jgi:excisionase family DNA binding protein